MISRSDMKKPLTNQVLEYLEALYKADPNVTVSTRTINAHFGRKCGPIVSDLHRTRGLLVMVLTDKEGRNKIVNYRIDASKGFEPPRQFDNAAYLRELKLKAARQNENAIKLHEILFRKIGNHAEAR